MGESITTNAERAINKQGTFVPCCSPKICNFGQVARLLWPRKTAAELAFRVGVTERAAKYWIAGDREPSAAAIAIVVAEILR